MRELALPVAVILAMVALLAWLVLGAEPVEMIGLRKDEWMCVETESQTRMQPVMIGKMILQQPVTTTRCVAYSRKREP